MNSTGAVSPDTLVAESRVAGNSFGDICTEDRLRGFVMTREDMVTAIRS